MSDKTEKKKCPACGEQLSYSIHEELANYRKNFDIDAKDQAEAKLQKLAELVEDAYEEGRHNVFDNKVEYNWNNIELRLKQILKGGE